VPVWHKAAQQWVKDGRLVLLGVTQEQHPERCSLFAQWQGIQWPILHDPINALQTTGVPILVALDEYGIVRGVGPRLESFERDFLDKSFADGAAPNDAKLTPPRDTNALGREARTADTSDSWRRLGDALAIWETPRQLDEAISAYRHAIRLNSADLNARFRLGVCFRMRHETERRHESDFSDAVRSWEDALGGQPNQYIWRRRIQQYGPRLMKPYPFYDWVTQARNEILQRGELPVLLPVLPSGAEIARPSRTFVADESSTSPDPQGAIRRDSRPLIEATVTVVPTQVKPGETARVHVTLVPAAERKTYWNNEAEPLRLWVDPPPGWHVTRRLLVARPGEQPETNEVRRLDFEVQVAEDAAGTGRLSAFALYYVCEDVGGTCLYLRKDIPIEIPLVTAE